MANLLIAILLLILTSMAACLPQIFPTSNYQKVLRFSLLFYEAQRSGYLPKNNRIPWRSDSALNDKGQNGEDLTGGYYDASDFVKFGFTMAFTTTLLAWGVLSYEDAYKSADQYEQALDAIKWSSDYFIKCHVNRFEFYGQVGDFVMDHRFWGRPEELNMTRPAYKIDAEHPGSELAGETSAALAATALVFSNTNNDYSQLLLKHAVELYEFAVKYQGLYHEVIPGAKMYFQSTKYEDELAWAALWLYKATGNKTYLHEAEEFYKNFNLKERPSTFFYNNKTAGVQALLAEVTQNKEYKETLKSFCDYSVNEQKRTSKGLIYIDKAGTLSHASNIAFICLKAARMNISTSIYINFAKQQIDYMLGSTGRSFLVGYGNDYPKKVHHSASSCPDLPSPCNWEQYKSNESNPKILYGALVSGPDRNDYYEDRRDEFLYNEVTLDYNAGFQGVAAGLIHFLRPNQEDSLYKKENVNRQTSSVV